MKKRIGLWHYILGVVFIITFTIVVLCIIPIVLFNDLVFGPIKGWNYNYRVFAKAFKVIFFFVGIRQKTLYEYDHDASKKYVFVLNHVSYFDIPEMLMGVAQPVRILAKRGPEKVPIFGYYYRKSTILVDRTSNESRKKSMDRLKTYLGQGISILLCPEGTFNMTTEPLKEFYDGAFRIAIETQTNIKPIVLLDTFNTLHYSSFGVENGKSRMVYLQEISVDGLTMDDVPKLKQKVFSIMEEALIRYKVDWIAKK